VAGVEVDHHHRFILKSFVPNLRESISSDYRPIGAELEQMVIIEGLLMEIISIVIQHPLNLLYPVVKDEFQFRPLNFTHKFPNASEKILWPWDCCLASAVFICPKSQKSDGAKSGL
jgi:hypothetical protein